MTEAQESNIIDLSQLTADVDWDGRGDQFVEYLREAMPWDFSALGWRNPEGPEANDPFRLNGWRLVGPNNLIEILLFFTSESGVSVLALCASEPQSPDDLEPWFTGIKVAAARAQELDPEWNWSCFLGTDSDIGSPQKLVKEAGVGSHVIEPATTPHTEYGELSGYPTLSGGHTRTTYPVLLRGSSRGCNWHHAQSKAVEQANHVAAVFSLAFARFWRIRETPFPSEGGRHEPPEWRWPSEDAALDVHALGATEEIEPPGWVDEAYRLLCADENFSRALFIYHQGLRLIDSVPSMSLICFVASIEKTGELYSRSGGSRQRFRAALETAVPGDEIPALMGTYSLRSSTAHSGKLHAGEQVGADFALADAHYFAPESSFSDFKYRTLWSLEKAARSVLVARVAGESSSGGVSANPDVLNDSTATST